MPTLTPSPRRRKDGTVNWQVHYHYYDADGVRRGTAESFYEDYEEAVWWCDYVARHGLDQARLILDAKRGGSGDGTLLSDWLIDHADRLLKVGSIDAPTHRHYLGYVRNDIIPFFGESARLDAVTQAAYRLPSSRERHSLNLLVVCLYLGLVIANFVWLWPILTGTPITPSNWNAHLWLSSWR